MSRPNPWRAARNAAQRLHAIREEQRAQRDMLADLAHSLADIGQHVEHLQTAQHELQAAHSSGHREITQTFDRHAQILRAIFEDEPAARQRVWAMRDDPSYDRPFDVEDPLVSVFITTYSNAEALATRSIPSVLAQTHQNLELWVVGDDASPEVEAAVRSFDDPRVNFANLTVRGPYPDDPREFWHVAGCGPANEGTRLARGEWIAPNCDDDCFTPDHVEKLLRAARERRLEVVWGQIRSLRPDGTDYMIGSFPPACSQFGVQAALFHRGLRSFTYELADALFGDPGDWAWMRRLMRAGVRMGMIEDVVVDYYPSQLWGTPAREPGLL